MARRPASRPLLSIALCPLLATRRPKGQAMPTALCWWWWILWCLAMAGIASAVTGTTGNGRRQPRSPSEEQQATRPKLLVILVQGVRADYIDHAVHPGFARLAQGGIRAEYVLPVFPSSPYPNAYSIATGLYPESHGIVADAMYDTEKRDLFLGVQMAGSSLPWSHWWERAEPIWLLAERRRLRSAVYWWPGCEVALNETRPAICMPQRSVPGWRSLDHDFRNKLDEVLEVFDTDELSLAMLQYGAVAYFGRHRGPESKERHKALAEFDHHLNYLIDQLEALNLTQKVTLMVVSDHGIANTGPESTTDIMLDKYSPYIKYMLNFGSHSMVLPRKDMFRPLHRALIDARVEGLQVYTKDEIPARYHIKHSPRVLPLFLMTTPKYFILPLSDSTKTKVNHKKRFFGYHGYDPELPEMRTIFYAQGPGIKRDYVIKPLVNVDHYNFMCHALGLEPKPNNGSWARMDEGLVESEVDFPRYGSSKYNNAASSPTLGRHQWLFWSAHLEHLSLAVAAVSAQLRARHVL